MLILPEGASITSGSLEIRIGDMNDGTSSAVSWTVVFGRSGSQTLRVEASGLDSDGNPCKVSGSATVVVSEPPDFTISASPSSLSIRQGESAVASISIGSIGGFSDPVSLTAIGQPSGLTVTFTPSTVTPPRGSSASSEVSVRVDSSTGTGSYSIMITGRSGTLSHSTTLTITVTQKPGLCLIATAVYGSEWTPEVSLLRAFRDNIVLSTFAGSSFMQTFNAWYYSFSPYVANFIASEPTIKIITRIMLYPLLAILRVAVAMQTFLSFNQELSIIVSGLAASYLIGVVYCTPLAACIIAAAKHRRIFRSRLKPSSD